MRYNIIDNYKEAAREMNRKKMASIMDIMFGEKSNQNADKIIMNKARYCFGLAYKD